MLKPFQASLSLLFFKILYKLTSGIPMCNSTSYILQQVVICKTWFIKIIHIFIYIHIYVIYIFIHMKNHIKYTHPLRPVSIPLVIVVMALWEFIHLTHITICTPGFQHLELSTTVLLRKKNPMKSIYGRIIGIPKCTISHNNMIVMIWKSLFLKTKHI